MIDNFEFRFELFTLDLVTYFYDTVFRMTSALTKRPDGGEVVTRVNAFFDGVFSPLSTPFSGSSDTSTYDYLSACMWDVLGSSKCPALPLKTGINMQLESMLTDFEAAAWEYNVSVPGYSVRKGFTAHEKNQVFFADHRSEQSLQILSA